MRIKGVRQFDAVSVGVGVGVGVGVVVGVGVGGVGSCNIIWSYEMS